MAHHKHIHIYCTFSFTSAVGSLSTIDQHIPSLIYISNDLIFQCGLLFSITIVLPKCIHKSKKYWENHGDNFRAFLFLQIDFHTRLQLIATYWYFEHILKLFTINILPSTLVQKYWENETIDNYWIQCTQVTSLHLLLFFITAVVHKNIEFIIIHLFHFTSLINM